MKVKAKKIAYISIAKKSHTIKRDAKRHRMLNETVHIAFLDGGVIVVKISHSRKTT
jgi:hypothetical protein